VTELPVLRTVLGDYPHTAPLKNGDVAGAGVRLDLLPVSPIHRAFAPMVRDGAYDLCELAVVTALQAIAYGRPVVLLPAVVAARFQRGCLIAHASRPVRPEELKGKRVGVRSYTQTTGMWVRAHLAEDYGLRAQDVRWITRDGAHVAQYTDPEYVTREPHSATLPDLLREGSIDAAVLGNDLPQGDEFVRVVPDAAARDEQWWRQHGFMPVNHMVAVAASACREKASAVRESYALLRRADASVERPDGTPHPTVFGFERLRGPLETVIDACLAQGLLPRRLTPEEVFGPAREVLGSDAD
jgi:4,5-dihydroxyphthalate decarboxylase